MPAPYPLPQLVLKPQWGLIKLSPHQVQGWTLGSPCLSLTYLVPFVFCMSTLCPYLTPCPGNIRVLESTF